MLFVTKSYFIICNNICRYRLVPVPKATVRGEMFLTFTGAQSDATVTELMFYVLY